MTKAKSYTFQELKSLKSMVWPALRTFTRGSRIEKDGIEINGSFPNVFVEPKQLHAYRNYFGFRSELPITYLYLLAQRAQAELMLEKAYTLSIPGTIHLSTNIALVNEINPNERLAIETNIKVQYKSEGSLVPEFEVSFFQGDALVAKANGANLVKRKKSGNNKKRPKPEIIQNADIELEWLLEKKTALEYANLSADHNPIHKSTLGAKLLGLKSQIIHGWYVASRCAQHIEQNKRRVINGFNIEFLGVHALPGNYVFKNNANLFQTVDEKQNKVLSQGSFNFL